ncbi:MAG: InlB B-repeat-containing protein, partial [Oscillospiraceae bacterium]|nr:InlB B-repeat-containing protein [Oscillospiraceae bacterium]
GWTAGTWTSDNPSHIGGPFTTAELLDLVIDLDTTFTLTFEQEPPETWTVTFLYNDGTPTVYSLIDDVQNNTAIAPPTDPARTGHTFTYWTIDPAGDVAWDFADGVIGNLRLYAQWTPNTFDVTFDWGTWTYVPADYVVENVLWGTFADAIEPSVIPNRAGHIFDGWYPGTEDYKLTEARTFTAQWIAVFTLTYDLNGGEGGPYPLVVEELQPGEHLLDVTAASEPTHDFFDDRQVVFVGWSLTWVDILEPDDARPILVDRVTIIDACVTVFAVWTFVDPLTPQHTVTFYLNCGDPMVVHAAEEVTNNTTVSKPEDPEREGYIFMGWYLRDEEGEYTPFCFTALITEPLSLFARWEEEIEAPLGPWTVTFLLAGGTHTGGGALEQSVPHGEDAAPPTGLTRLNYTFIGWTDVYTNVMSDRTLTAMWAPIPTTFAVTFHWGTWTGAPADIVVTNVSSGTLAHTIQPDAESTPTRNGFTFAGWSPAAQNYVLTGVRTFVAQWQQEGPTDPGDGSGGGPGGPGGGPSGPGGGGGPSGPTDPTDPIRPERPELPWFTDEHHQYLIGWEDGTIRPTAQITRAEVATIFFRLLNDETRAQNWAPRTNTFADVNAEHWHHNAITTLTNLGVVHGRSDMEFDPNAVITRGEFIAIAARFVPQSERPSAEHNTIAMFDDAVGHWAEEYIRVMQYFGWILGDADGNANPNDLITRAEVAAAVNRMLGRVHERPDTDISKIDCISTYRMDDASGRERTAWLDNSRHVGSWFYLYLQEATHSTYFERTDCGTYVIWTQILPPIDWTVSQRPDAGPNDHRNR